MKRSISAHRRARQHWGTKAVILGKGGSGKTSLFYLFTDSLCGISRDGDLLLDFQPKKRKKGDTKIPLIGHGPDSVTTTSSVCTVNGINIYDTPSLCCTDSSKSLESSLGIDNILRSPGKTAILLVIPECDLEEKAQEAYESITTLIEMFPNKDQLKQATALVITKAKSKDPTVLLERLDKSKVNFLLKYLLENKHERVFVVPAPSEVGEYRLKERERMLDFVKQNAVDSLQHRIVLSPTTACDIHDLSFPLDSNVKTGDVKAAFLDVFYLTIYFSDQKEVLKDYWSIAKELCNAANEGMNSFINCCKGISHKFPFILTCLKMLEKLANKSYSGYDEVILRYLSNELGKCAEILSKKMTCLQSIESLNLAEEEILKQLVNNKIGAAQYVDENARITAQKKDLNNELQKLSSIGRELEQNCEYPNETDPSEDCEIQNIDSSDDFNGENPLINVNYVNIS